MKNDEQPIGFTLELAMQPDSFSSFSRLPENEQKEIIDGAREVKSKDEMHTYVSNISDSKGSF